MGLYVRDRIIYNDEDKPRDHSDPQSASLPPEHRARRESLKNHKRLLSVFGWGIGLVALGAFILPADYKAFCGLAFALLVILYNVTVFAHNEDVRQVRKDVDRHKRDNDGRNGWHN